jgi:hypothetical protein
MAEEGGGAPPTAPAEGSGGGAGGAGGAGEAGIYREAPATTSNATTGGAPGEDLVQKARGLMRRIVAERASPNPSLPHALAAILEQEEARSGFQLLGPGGRVSGELGSEFGEFEFLLGVGVEFSV